MSLLLLLPFPLPLPSPFSRKPSRSCAQYFSLMPIGLVLLCTTTSAMETGSANLLGLLSKSTTNWVTSTTEMCCLAVRDAWRLRWRCWLGRFHLRLWGRTCPQSLLQLLGGLPAVVGIPVPWLVEASSSSQPPSLRLVLPVSLSPCPGHRSYWIWTHPNHPLWLIW